MDFLNSCLFPNFRRRKQHRKVIWSSDARRFRNYPNCILFRSFRNRAIVFSSQNCESWCQVVVSCCFYLPCIACNFWFALQLVLCPIWRKNLGNILWWLTGKRHFSNYSYFRRGNRLAWRSFACVAEKIYTF